MRYVAARMEDDVRDTAYRVYVTDSLRAVTGAEKRYIDIVNDRMHAPKEKEKTADEIITDVISKFGLKMG